MVEENLDPTHCPLPLGFMYKSWHMHTYTHIHRDRQAETETEKQKDLGGGGRGRELTEVIKKENFIWYFGMYAVINLAQTCYKEENPSFVEHGSQKT